MSTVGGNDALVSSCGTSTYTPQPSQNDNLPVSCVSWTEAYAFCIWDGGFLPSDAEWGYAAAGGSAQREFPWGSADSGRWQSVRDEGISLPIAQVLAGEIGAFL